MSKFRSLQDAYKHFEEKGGGNTGFFTLKNHMESAVVRFLHEGEDDLDWYILHKAEVNGKDRWVLCTEESDCPLCQSGNRPQLKIFLQLIDKREPDKVKVWERGQKFVPKVISFINRNGTLCGQPIEVERLGKPRDPATDYQLHALERDNKTLADLPFQREQLVGENAFILKKSHAEMQQIADGTYVPPQQDDNSNMQNQNTAEPRKREERSGSDIF